MRIPSPLKRGRRHQGVSPFIDWKVYLSIYLSIHPSIHVSIYNTVCVYIYLFIKKGCDQRPPPALAATATWSGPMAPKRLNLPGFSVNVPNVPASTDCLIKFCKVVARTWGEVHELSWPQRRFKRRKCKPWGLGRIFFYRIYTPIDSIWFHVIPPFGYSWNMSA